MAMKEPPHPGQSVRLDCLEALGLSVTQGADVLGVSRQALNNLVNGKAGLSPEMAIRLSKAFGGSPETWLALQAAYDLAQARRNADTIAVRRYALPSGQQEYAHGLRIEDSRRGLADIEANRTRAADAAIADVQKRRARTAAGRAVRKRS